MEHVFETLETDAGLGVVVDGTMAITGVTAQREEVVRCRDCGRAYRRGGGVYCSRVLQWGSNDRPAPLPVGPDGFCAWGRKRKS